MRYVAPIMEIVRTNVDVVASKQPNQVGVTIASIAHTQPVLFWGAQSVSKPKDYWGGWVYLTTRLKCSILKVCVIVAYMAY
jgi:hypothetical protein